MVDFFTVNTTKKPFDNLKVRKALAYAINKPEMIAVLLEGRGTPRNTILAKHRTTQMRRYLDINRM